MTLFRMIFDTLNFIFVVCCYLAIMSTVFSTLFGSLNDFEGGEQYIDTVEANNTKSSTKESSLINMSTDSR